MPGAGLNLGFVAVAVVVATLLWFWAGRRWRRAAERRVEVMRLAWLAAEEAARAEAEAEALAYPVPPPPSAEVDDDSAGVDRGGARVWPVPQPQAPLPPQCAVCYRHTTTRCSRCKAVRYCSGKCQIIHWRQGHKNECYPPIIDNHYNDAEGLSNLRGSQTDKSDLSGDSTDMETKAQPKPTETSFMRPSLESNLSSVGFAEDNEVKTFIDTSGKECCSDSFADSSSPLLSSSASLSSAAASSSRSTFSGHLDTSDDVSPNDDRTLHNAKMGEAPCIDCPEDPIRRVNDTEEKLKNKPFTKANIPVNRLSHTSDLKKVCNSNVEDAECNLGGTSESRSTDSERQTYKGPSKDAGQSEDHRVHTVAGSPSAGSSNLLPSDTPFVNKVSSPNGNGQTNHRRVVSSISVANGKSADVWLLRPKSTRPLPSFSSADRESTAGIKHSVSQGTPSENDSSPAPPTRSSETIGSVPNGISDLKTSVRRVVQQFKSSHLSKHHSLVPRNDISDKHKMLFPYDLFIKLYSCDKVELHPCGLTNCGNSCYANAVLQCLAFTRPLASYLLQGFHTKICSRGGWCFTCEFASLLVKARQGQSPLSPIGILSQIHNIGSNLGQGKQEDAHEFLRYAIDTMQSVCLKEAGADAAGTSAEETTLIQLIFGGYLRSKIKCTKCHGKSERQERMMDLTVEIDGDIGTLEEALAQFTATEVLDGKNKYHCSRCKSYERAKKKLTVLEAPNVLTIALKRFQSGKFGKLNKAVRFPEILDLVPYMSGTDKSPVYSLYAVVVHQDIMNAAFSGHYVCYVKSTQGKWYKTDDSKVKPVDVGSVLAKNAYMLFYARCSPRAPSLIRNTISENLKTKKKPLTAQQKSHGSLSERRLPFPRTDSSSDNSSLFSYSDEGSCSTESTRDSTSTEEFSEYMSGDSDRATSWSNYFEDLDSRHSSPSISGHFFVREGGESLNYGERGSQILYSDTATTNHRSSSSSSRTLTGDRRGKEGVELDDEVVMMPNVLMRRSSTSSSRERRGGQTFY